MAADDARALAFLLNCPCVNVLAVVTSDGASPPDIGATNVCRMLRFIRQTGAAARHWPHGGLTPDYFEEVRTVSLKHWLDFDRNTIFEEAEEAAVPQP